jgi:2-methylfumaryl-CoA hydratase
MSGNRIEIGGPYFEDFAAGQIMPDAPAVTITAGHAAVHQALFGDRLRLPLDHTLSQRVTGHDQPLANPSLVCNIAIGQTTYASQRVKANLFYRGLVFKRPVYIGDTIHTTTRVAALKQNLAKPGRPATGLVVLEMRVANQRDEEVLLFWRCPMIPCRDPQANTGHTDSLNAIPADIDLQAVKAFVPSNWRLDLFRETVAGPHFDDFDAGTTYAITSRDTITCAPELVRMTLNIAVTHTDAASSVYGKRLVYGGHTISMAAAQITHALPNLVALVAWRSCDHTAPVFEGDILRTEVTIDQTHPLDRGGGLVDLHAIVFAERGDQAPEPGRDIQVLDWRVLGLMA